MDQPEMKHDHSDLRATLGRYATGVTVITAMHGEHPVGITVNSFASLSLDPALILWSPAKSSTRHQVFVDADAFNVHILSIEQKSVCDAFTKDMHGFDGLEFVSGQMARQFCKDA